MLNIIQRRARVQGLDVSVKVLLWITKSAVANDGVASVSQSNVPSGRYDVRVWGKALDGVSSVKIVIVAKTTLTMGANGSYTLDYDTSSLPPGNISIQVGSITKVVELGEAENVDPVPVISCDKLIERGASVLFDGSGSRDPDGSIVRYNWDFGDGVVARALEEFDRLLLYALRTKQVGGKRRVSSVCHY